MDGSSQRVLLSKDVVWPNGLAIDFKGKPKRYETLEFIQTCHRKNKRQMHKGEQNNVIFQQKLLNWFQIGCYILLSSKPFPVQSSQSHIHVL